MYCRVRSLLLFVVALWLPAAARAAEPQLTAFFQANCTSCHDRDTHEGNLDLTNLDLDAARPESFARLLKIHDRVAAGEMPPKDQPRPDAAAKTAVVGRLGQMLRAAERARLAAEGRTGVRRMTRGEYENTIRDLFDMPGIALRGSLPDDGSAHGFDTNCDALDISHVNLAKYMEAADQTLDLAIATRPAAPSVYKNRISLANPGGFVSHIICNGDGVLLKDKQPDPDFPPAGEFNHIDQGAHERMGWFRDTTKSVGLFRHEDESVSPYFIDFVAVYPGLYRVRASFFAFGWDKGKVLPARGTEAARLSVVQLTGDGRGGQHPSYVLGYYAAPSLQSQEHELFTWLNHNELIGFNTASLAPTANYNRKGRAMAFTGPGIACDWLEIEGPLHECWPPKSHQVLFGQLPIVEFKTAEHPGVKPPTRKVVRQLSGKNRPDPATGLYTVSSEQPLADADRLLAAFLPQAFRRPVPDDVRAGYVALVDARLKAGDAFEMALRYAYRAALCSSDFLYHLEPEGRLDDYALACRLSYFLWNSLPDGELRQLAAASKLHEPDVMHGQVERMLQDARSRRFVEDFLGQWLKLRLIAANDPDKKLYPEFSPYLQDSMLAETRAYFRELIDKNLDASYLVRSNFAMLNEKLAVHYGIEGVSGPEIRRVELPPGCPRGGFLTQAAVLKVTANGTTTSPVPRGAFVMDRLLGQPPEPPPASVPAVEPDVRGATTIRDQLDKHRSNATCASCHAKIDPPGFALESFDVIGGQRDRYRSIEEGDDAPRGKIDRFIGIGFKLGKPVDASGMLPDGRKFSGINEFEELLAADKPRLLKNLAQQFIVYSTGRDLGFGDRDAVAAIVDRTQSHGGGIRTLIHEVVQSELFQTK